MTPQITLVQGLVTSIPGSDHFEPGYEYVIRSTSELFCVDVVGMPAVVWDALDPDPKYTLSVSSADLDGDGDVDINDFLDLIAAWGPCPDPPEPCLADLDGDCEVGIEDFLILLANWSPTAPSLEAELEEACLTEDDWDEYVDVMTDPNSSQADKDRYDCWMRHYIRDCNKCFCVHPLGICPSPNPFI